MSDPYYDFDAYVFPEWQEPELEGPEEASFLCVARASDIEQNSTLFNNIVTAIEEKVGSRVRTMTLSDQGQVRLSGHIMPGTRTVIVFGINPSHLSLNIDAKAYRLSRLERYDIIFCHNLEKLDANMKYKARLWPLLMQQKDTA